jgi:hypothetical protein
MLGYSSDTAWEIRLTGSLQPDCNEKLLGDMAKVETMKYMLSFETHETPPTKDISAGLSNGLGPRN